MNKIISRRLKTTTALTSVLMASIVVDNSFANPEGGKVVAGDVTITEPNPTTVQVEQFSQKAIVDWRSFNIAPNETTRFVQPNSQAWILNRINGSHNPTTIQGTLEANGNVAIVNPDGIVFSQGARIDVNSLIATTHNISNDDFMAGQMNFNIPGNPAASVINEGSISIGDHGLGAFVAPGVRNSGVITARLGNVSLAAGNKFTLDLYGDGLVNLAIDDQITHEVIDLKTGKLMSDLVKNSGTIKADGGTVALKAATARRAVNAVINNTGVIEANTIGLENGKIILGAQTAATKPQNAPQQKVKVSGRLQTTTLPTRVPIPKPSPRTGGDIEITGEAIELANATIDASGVNGGGAILIGGDYLGGNGDAAIINQYNIPLAKHKVPTAKFLTANAGSLIKADALENGNGGKVILWSDDTTSTAADITAKGGNLGGDGGFIETSGKQLLDVKKAADASAINGAAGTWLLDPDNLKVTDDVSGSFDVSFGERVNSDSPHYMTANGTYSTIESSFIETGLNNGTDVFLVADGNIDIRSNIEKTSGDDSTLTINAGDEISILGSDIVSTSNQLNLKLIANNIGIHGANLQTRGGNIEMTSADEISFGGIGSGSSYQVSKINSGNGNITLRTDDYISLIYGTLLMANQINATAEHISYQSTVFEGQPEIAGVDYPFVSKSGITLTGSEFEIALRGDDTAKLELNYEGDGSGNDRYSLTPIKGFSIIALNRGKIDSGSYWFWIYGSGGDNIRGAFEPDGAHFTPGLSIKTSRNVQIDVGDQADRQSGLHFQSSEYHDIFTTLDSTDGKIEFFGVNNINGETPVASSLSVGGTKNVWLNSVKYSAPIVPEPTPITYTPKPVSGASLPTGDYVIGERIDIPLPTLFSVDGGSIVSQTVSRPTDGDFQIITVNGQKRLVGTYNGNPGTINLTFEATSNTQKSAQLSLPITFTSVDVVTPTPVVTPEPTPETPPLDEKIREEIDQIKNPENRVAIRGWQLPEDNIDFAFEIGRDTVPDFENSTGAGANTAALVLATDVFKQAEVEGLPRDTLEALENFLNPRSGATEFLEEVLNSALGAVLSDMEDLGVMSFSSISELLQNKEIRSRFLQTLNSEHVGVSLKDVTESSLENILKSLAKELAGIVIDEFYDVAVQRYGEFSWQSEAIYYSSEQVAGGKNMSPSTKNILLAASAIPVVGGKLELIGQQTQITANMIVRNIDAAHAAQKASNNAVNTLVESYFLGRRIQQRVTEENSENPQELIDLGRNLKNESLSSIEENFGGRINSAKDKQQFQAVESLLIRAETIVDAINRGDNLTAQQLVIEANSFVREKDNSTGSFLPSTTNGRISEIWSMIVNSSGIASRSFEFNQPS